MSNRQSNWELFRIVAMLMIVAGHFILQSDFLKYTTGFYYYLGAYMGFGSIIAVNMFLMLGVWFMVDAKFCARRVIKLYFNVWTLTVPLTLFVCVCGYQYSLKDVIRGIFPFCGKGLWFASAYLALILISPWLNKIFLLSSSSLKKLIIVLTGLISFWVTIYSFDRTENEWLDCLVWFSYVYIVIGYYKKHVSLHLNKWMVIFVGSALYLLLVTIHEIAADFVVSKITWAFLADFKTMPNFFISMCFFYFFEHLDLSVNNQINYIASGAFTTYIFHQTPAFMHFLWYDFYKCNIVFIEYNPLIYSVFVIVSVYILGLIIERFRRKYVEPILLNCRFVKYIEKKIDYFYYE